MQVGGLVHASATQVHARTQPGSPNSRSITNYPPTLARCNTNPSSILTMLARLARYALASYGCTGAQQYTHNCVRTYRLHHIGVLTIRSLLLRNYAFQFRFSRLSFSPSPSTRCLCIFSTPNESERAGRIFRFLFFLLNPLGNYKNPPKKTMIITSDDYPFFFPQITVFGFYFTLFLFLLTGFL